MRTNVTGNKTSQDANHSKRIRVPAAGNYFQLRIKTHEEEVNAPVSVRADLSRGLVLVGPVLLGVLRQNLTGQRNVVSLQKLNLTFLFKKKNTTTLVHLLKLLLDVCVRLQLELPARVGPVDQEQPLLAVHLFDQDGCLLVVPHLGEKQTHKHRLK